MTQGTQAVFAAAAAKPSRDRANANFVKALRRTTSATLVSALGSARDRLTKLDSYAIPGLNSDITFPSTPFTGSANELEYGKRLQEIVGTPDLVAALEARKAAEIAAERDRIIFEARSFFTEYPFRFRMVEGSASQGTSSSVNPIKTRIVMRPELARDFEIQSEIRGELDNQLLEVCRARGVRELYRRILGEVLYLIQETANLEEERRRLVAAAEEQRLAAAAGQQRLAAAAGRVLGGKRRKSRKPKRKSRRTQHRRRQ